MNDAIDAAIKALAEKAKQEENPLDAMQFAQAALNLAQAKGVLEAINRK